VAIDFLHTHCIAHLDVKPANFLVKVNTALDKTHPDYVNIEVTDLGLSQEFDPTTKLVHRHESTPFYRAPEQHRAPESLLRTCCCCTTIPAPVFQPTPIPGRTISSLATLTQPQAQPTRGERAVDKALTDAQDPLTKILCGCTVTNGGKPCACLKSDKHMDDGEKCDVFGLGATLYHMITKQAPWRQEWDAFYTAECKAGKLNPNDDHYPPRNRFLFDEVVMKQKLPALTHIGADFPVTLIQVMKECMRFHPNERLTITTLKHRLLNVKC